MTHDQLAAEILALVAQMPRITTATREGDNHIALHIVGAALPHTLSLTNAANYVRTHSDPHSALRSLLQAAIDTHDDEAAQNDWVTARALLLRTFLIPAHYQDRHPQGGFIGEEVLPGILEVAVLDHPRTMTYVDHNRVRHWAVTPAQVLQAARDNLREAPATGTWRRLANLPLWELHEADEYSSARLAQPHKLTRSGPPGQGQLVLAMPNRHTILAGRLIELKPHLAIISETTLDIWKTRDPRSATSPVLYTVDRTGRLTPLRRGPGRAGLALRRAEAALAVHEYGLQAKHGTVAADERWAELRVLDTSTGELPSPTTCTSWTGDTQGDLLPKADLVAISDRGGNTFLVRWDHFIQKADLNLTARQPARWCTATPLTDDQRAALQDLSKLQGRSPGN